MWPAMPLVAECRTRSTPVIESRPLAERRREGGVDHGHRPRMAPSSSRSTRSSLGAGRGLGHDEHGLAGRTAAAKKAPGSVPSTKVTSMPKRGQGHLQSSWVPAYSWRWRRWSPAEQSPSTTAVTAPMPEANAWAGGPPPRARRSPPPEGPHRGVAEAAVEPLGADRGGHLPGPVHRRVTNVVVAWHGRQRGVALVAARPDGAGLGQPAARGVVPAGSSRFSTAVRNSATASPISSVPAGTGRGPAGCRPSHGRTRPDGAQAVAEVELLVGG